MSVERRFEKPLEERSAKSLSHYLQNLLIVLDQKVNVTHPENDHCAQQIPVGLALTIVDSFLQSYFQKMLPWMLLFHSRTTSPACCSIGRPRLRLKQKWVVKQRPQWLISKKNNNSACSNFFYKFTWFPWWIGRRDSPVVETTKSPGRLAMFLRRGLQIAGDIT